MKIYLINLPAASDRLAFQENQLRALGLDFDRIEAIRPESISEDIKAEYWQGWQRPLLNTERACFLSHHDLWNRIALSETPALILEDDAVLSETLPAFLDIIGTVTRIDHITLETRGRWKLLGMEQHPELPIRRLYQDRTGAAAYLLWPSGARKLLAHTRRTAMLADAAICSAYNLSSWQADPPLALQLDRCALYGITPPIVTTSSIDSTIEKRDRRPPIYRARRIFAQIRMGVRRLANISRVRRDYLSPRPEDFTYLID